MNRFKFNDGNGALVCNECDRIIVSPITLEQAKFRKFMQCPYCYDRMPLTHLDNRLKRLNIEIECINNFPWIYLYKVNGNLIKEKFLSEHGFTIGYLPIKPNEKFVFTDITEIFKIIRKYI